MISQGCGDHKPWDGTCKRTFLWHCQTGNLHDRHFLSISTCVCNVLSCAITWLTSFCCFTTQPYLGYLPTDHEWKSNLYSVACTLMERTQGQTHLNIKRVTLADIRHEKECAEFIWAYFKILIKTHFVEIYLFYHILKKKHDTENSNK